MPDDEPPAEHLEQLARSLAMSPSLTDADRHAVIALYQALTYANPPPHNTPRPKGA